MEAPLAFSSLLSHSFLLRPARVNSLFASLLDSLSAFPYLSPRMNVLTPLFEGFASSVYPDLDPEDRHALERSFYVGCASMIQAQQEAVMGLSPLESREALDELIREVQRAISRLAVDYGDPSLN